MRQYAKIIQRRFKIKFSGCLLSDGAGSEAAAEGTQAGE